MEVLPCPDCPLCGRANDCAAVRLGRHDVACWCGNVQFDPAALARVPAEQRNKACLCQACATGTSSLGLGLDPAPPPTP